jgi:hypothetical protein
MKGVLQFINDVAFEHITGEDDIQTVYPCSLKFTFREGRWERTTKGGKKQCRRVVKCMTCEKALHVAQAMEALGLALQAFTYVPYVSPRIPGEAPEGFFETREEYQEALDGCIAAMEADAPEPEITYEQAMAMLA